MCNSSYYTPSTYPSTNPSTETISSSVPSETPSVKFPWQGVEGPIVCGETISDETEGAENNYGSSSPEHFYSFTLSDRDRIQFDLCGSDFDTLIHIYNANTHKQITFNDDSNSCGHQSNITISLTEGDYYVMIEGFWNSFGSSILEVDLEQGTYYLQVDGHSDSVSNYNVTMECNPFTTSQPSMMSLQTPSVSPSS